MVDIREYKNGDEEEIVSLFNQVFNADRSKEYWKWQFIENPAKDPVIVVAEEDSSLAGQCTLLPSYMVVNNEEMLAGHSIDTMIKEDFRGQGLHIEMANKSYEIGVKEGIRFRFGFPSQLALRGLLGSIGGSLVSDTPIFICPYKLDNFLVSIVKSKIIAKILSIPLILLVKFVYKENKIKPKENYIFKEIDEFNEDFDKLWDKVKVNSPIMTRRDSKFLNWRIKNHPETKYKTFGAYLGDDLVGYIIVKVETRTLRGKYKSKLGSIIDIIGLNEEIAAALYYKSKEFFKEEDTDFTAAWVSDSMKYKGLFVKLGFIKTRSTIPFVVKNLTEDKEMEEFITKENNWYLMPIESDFY